jgi:hypothetical protein
MHWNIRFPLQGQWQWDLIKMFHYSLQPLLNIFSHSSLEICNFLLNWWQHRCCWIINESIGVFLNSTIEHCVITFYPIENSTAINEIHRKWSQLWEIFLKIFSINFYHFFNDADERIVKSSLMDSVKEISNLFHAFLLLSLKHPAIDITHSINS